MQLEFGFLLISFNFFPKIGRVGNFRVQLVFEPLQYTVILFIEDMQNIYYNFTMPMPEFALLLCIGLEY